MPDSVNVYEAKTQLSQLLNRVEQGEEIVIARNGRPVARLAPLETKRPDRVPGLWKDRFVVPDGFDEFTEQDARDWYGD